ncbi:MAG: ABC transporter permease, partial [Scardovia wiggsiae]|nr:ABC transporter permease [Scardovia wiggsiae]
MSSSQTDMARTGGSNAVNAVKRFVGRNGALVGLLLLGIVLSFIAPSFLTATNLLNVGIQASTIAILAFGETFVIIAAGIDLSVGAVAAFSSMIAAYTGAMMGVPAWLTVIIGIVVGGLFGALSGIANAFL